MWTGRKTLASIENAIADLRHEEGQLDESLRSAVGETERLRKERADALRELARIKLDEMGAGRLTKDLDVGERRAAQLLDDYRLRMAALADRREAMLKEIAGAEQQRNAAAESVATALAAVEAVRTETEAKVRATTEWQAAKTVSDNATAVAAEAEKKAASSEAELAAKRKPYDDDPLFSYLWRRKFGTAEYHASDFARSIDRKLADFIGFADARPNYAALIEIPLRLREHANAKSAAAVELQNVLPDIERRAMIDAGIEPKERGLAEARHKHAAADQTVEEKHALMRKIDEERGTLVAGGSDTAYNQALETIASADGKDDLAALYAEARRTPTGADDAIVRRMETIDAGITKTDEEIAELRRTARKLAQRRLEVQQVRNRFRGAGYDHPNATFGNDNAIADALKSILAGAAGGVLWDVLRSGYSYRTPRGRGDFGGSSFPFPMPHPRGETSDHSSDGGWREPSSRGSWSSDGDGSVSVDMPDAGNDEFTTGGSF
jgi:hypothetical protein